MQTNIKKGTYIRLSEFHSKSKKDVTEWTEEIRRVATVNNWRATRIYTIIAAYLKDTAADYFKEVRGNVQQWDGGNAANNLKDLLIAQFVSDSTKDIWYSDYLNCW